MKKVFLNLRGNTLKIVIQSEEKNDADNEALDDALERIKDVQLIGRVTSYTQNNNTTTSLTIMLSAQERDLTPSIKRNGGELLH